MRRCYIIELGGEKELNEMDALELQPTIDDAIDWIQNNMESDSEYYNININCTIYIDYDKDDNDLTNQYCDALVYINTDDKIGIQVRKDECSDIETIIETNLSIISKITHKMTEVSD